MWVEQWRKGAARRSEAGQRALRIWADLVVRGDAVESAANAPRLRVALMGRVKAGKSTLINGIFGRTVAATHVEEQTSALHELLAVGSAGAESAGIQRASGTLVLDPDSLASECAQRRGDASFWTEVTAMTSRVHAPHLDPGMAFFDTPGVAAVTRDNTARAVDFLDACHVILWVTNGRELGNADDARYLEELRRRGRPVLPIITRGDTVDEDEREEVLEWFGDNFDWLDQPILTAATEWCAGRDLPARDALISRLNGFAEQRGSGAVDDLIDTLGRDLEEAASHELRDLRRLETVVEHVYRRAERTAHRTVAAVEDALRTRVDAIFDRQWQLIREDVDARVRARQDGDSSIQAAFRTHFADERIAEILSSVEAELQERLEQEWSTAFEQNMAELMDELSALEAENEQTALREMMKGLAAHEAADQRRSGAITVGTATVSAAATAWTAWFGAQAAAVSLGAAFLSVGLPIIGVGALAVVATRWWSRSSARADAVDRARTALEESKQAFVRDILEGRVLPRLVANCEEVARQVSEALVAEVTGGVTAARLTVARATFEALALGKFDMAIALTAPQLPGK